MIPYNFYIQALEIRVSALKEKRFDNATIQMESLTFKKRSSFHLIRIMFNNI